MVSLDGVVIALSQVKVGSEVFSFFCLFPCSENCTLRVLYGEFNAHLLLTFRTGFDIKRLGPYKAHNLERVARLAQRQLTAQMKTSEPKKTKQKILRPSLSSGLAWSY